MEHRQRSPCHARTLPAGTVAPGSVPAPAADRHRNRGTDHHRPRYAPGRTRRSRSHRQRRQKARAAAHHAPPPWPFSFAHLPALPPARPAGSAARHALGVAAVAPMTTPAHRSRSRSHRPPPAPGRISTASAAPDDHASSRPPHTMTTHQRQPCPTCTAPTACQPCQTSQQQRSRQRGGGGDLLCKFHVLCSFAFQVCPGGLPGLWGGAALVERCDPARASA